MKPDGVVTATMEPMETLDADPVMEAVPPAGEGADQVPPPSTESQETGQSEPQPTETPAPTTKTEKSNKPTDPKAKTKGPAKPKTTGTTATKPASRPGTAQSRLLNGTQKPQTNGVTKKPTTGPTDKKTTSTTGPAKKPPGTTGAPASRSPTKPAERKSTGATRPTSAPNALNGAKTGTAQPLRKTPSATSNEVKTKPKTTGPPSRPTSAAPSKPSTAVSTKADRPPVSKTTRPASGPPSSRPSSAAPKTATTKTTSPTKPAAPRTTTTTASKPATPRAGSTTPSAGRTPTQASKTTTTPLKKDVSKPSTPAAKKPAASPLTRPSPAKTTKPDTPKSTPAAKPDSTKKPAASSRAADAKTPSKPKEAKSTPSKEAAPTSKMPSAKPSTAKTTSPRKAVGSSTPTPVKRGPKPAAQPEAKAEEKQDTTPAVAAVAAAGAAAVGAGTVAALASVTVSEPEVPATETAQPLIKEEVVEPTPAPAPEPEPEPVPAEEPVAKSPEPAIPQLAAQLDLVHLEDTVTSVSPLGTTVMSPPTSPVGAPAMPMECQVSAEPVLDMHEEDEPWVQRQAMPVSHDDMPENLLEEAVKVQDDFLVSTPAVPTMQTEITHTLDAEPDLLSTYPTDNLSGVSPADQLSGVSPAAHFLGGSPPDHLLEVSPADHFLAGSPEDHLSGVAPADHLIGDSPSSPFQEQEEAVEKAEEEINEDMEDDEEENEDQEAQEFIKLPETMPTMPVTSAAPHMDELLSGPADFASSGWQGHGFDDMSSKQPSAMGEGMTSLLEDNQMATSVVDDFDLKVEKKEEPFMASPSIKTFYADEEEEEEEKVVDMDVGSEYAEKQHKVGREEEEEEEDEDVEMVSEGMTESGLEEACGNVDADDFTDIHAGDNLNCTAPQPPIPPATAWGQTNPFGDPWAQPASNIFASSSSPDAVAAQPETPPKSPKTWLEFSSPAQAPYSEEDPTECMPEEPSAPFLEEIEDSIPEDLAPPAAPAVGMSQSSTLSGAALAAHSSSETSTPEELRDYDSSSGVESRSDKQQTPIPMVQPDLEQDLGIHLERGDGEEEEAETLPADEVLGGPPTAPASAPSSPSTSGDEASDTEGEMQINDPNAPAEDDRMAAFDSPTPTRNLPALAEDEEAAETQVGDGGEEDGGTPQSANSVASYGFDCTSNSNAHSTAESCGKSPGIFSLENEDQLTEEAKDPSLIKELTLPSSAAAQAEELLGGPVDLLPLGEPGEFHDDFNEHQYMLCGKTGADLLPEADSLEPEARHSSSPLPGDGSDGQPPYYSTICDKTDNFLAGEPNGTTPAGGEPQQGIAPPIDQEEINHNYYLAPLQNNQWQQLQHHEPQQQPPNSTPERPTLMPSNGSPARGIFLTAVTEPQPQQLRRLEQHQQHLRQLQHRQELERQRRQNQEEEERQRAEQQRQLERQRRELLQLQLQQQQQEHRQRRQMLQWQLQLELEQQHQRQKQQQQQQVHKAQSAVLLSPSSGLCTIYEAMETSEEDDEGDEEEGSFEAESRNSESASPKMHAIPTDLPLRVANGNLRHPPQDLDWSRKVDMVQKLINQTLLLSGEAYPPILLLPGQGGGTLSPLESSLWPNLVPPLSSPSAMVTSVSSYSPDSQGSSPQGDWTVVEVETHH